MYIHIPFCFSRCNYCDYYKTTDLYLKKKYVESLISEIKYRSEQFKYPIETIFFGGGTPSLLEIYEVEKILSTIYNIFEVIPQAEVTFECNPDDLSIEYLTNIRSFGINRISIGIQSFSDNDLQIMGRRHNVKQAYKSIEMAFNAGFQNISADIIYGLPWNNIKLFKENLKQFISLKLPHFSAYHLEIETGTNFFNNKMKKIDDSESFEQYMLLCDTMQNIGMQHYEVSNYCMVGYFSRHNFAYWQRKPYLGIGAGAHSFHENCRFFNPKDVALYNMQNFDEIIEEEVLNKKEIYNEHILLGLRIYEGVNINFIKNKFTEFYRNFNDTAKKWINKNVLFVEGDWLKCFEKQWIIIDRVIEDFIEL
ncbi:MAG: radical SAM family heme chaperone HemW [Marinilabiliaceae bacterium]|nr:radical SAM family heme chaperone HemW [Marinilabiliaceae bacterium]